MFLIHTEDVNYRRDRKCGPGYLALNGVEAECPGECCSTDGECGRTDEHCVTKIYKDYRGSQSVRKRTQEIINQP